MDWKLLSTLFVFLSVNSVLSEFQLTVVHLNDIHSRFFGVTADGQPCSPHDDEEECLGGIARLATKIKEIRASEKNVLVLATGDFYLADSYYPYHGWKLASRMIPFLTLNATSLGNHDFDHKAHKTAAFILSLNGLPVLACNFYGFNTTFWKPLIKKSVVFRMGREKVGVVGFLSPKTQKWAFTAKKKRIKDEIVCVQKTVNKLMKRGVNKIIALGHSGFNMDQLIASNVSGVDIVVGGNSDIFLCTENEDNNCAYHKVHGRYPFVVEIPDEKTQETEERLVVHVPQGGIYLGRLRVTFDDYGRVVNYSGNPILLDESVKKDPKAELALLQCAETLDKHWPYRHIPEPSAVIGKTAVHLNAGRFGRECRLKECNIGNFITDAIVHNFITNKKFVNAAVWNAGAIRASIPRGNITMRDLTKAVYLGGLVQPIQMSGWHVRDMLEKAVDEYDPTGISSPGSFLQVSGLKVTYDMQKPARQRVTSLEIKCPECKDDSFKPVKSSGTYVVAMPMFLQFGGDGICYHEKHDVHSDITDALAFVSYLEIIDPITTAIEGRITVLNAGNETEKTTAATPSDKREHRSARDATIKDTFTESTAHASSNITETTKFSPAYGNDTGYATQTTSLHNSQPASFSNSPATKLPKEPRTEITSDRQKQNISPARQRQNAETTLEDGIPTHLEANFSASAFTPIPLVTPTLFMQKNSSEENSRLSGEIAVSRKQRNVYRTPDNSLNVLSPDHRKDNSSDVRSHIFGLTDFAVEASSKHSSLVLGTFLEMLTDKRLKSDGELLLENLIEHPSKNKSVNSSVTTFEICNGNNSDALCSSRNLSSDVPTDMEPFRNVQYSSTPLRRNDANAQSNSTTPSKQDITDTVTALPRSGNSLSGNKFLLRVWRSKEKKHEGLNPSGSRLEASERNGDSLTNNNQTVPSILEANDNSSLKEMTVLPRAKPFVDKSAESTSESRLHSYAVSHVENGTTAVLLPGKSLMVKTGDTSSNSLGNIYNNSSASGKVNLSRLFSGNMVYASTDKAGVPDVENSSATSNSTWKAASGPSEIADVHRRLMSLVLEPETERTFVRSHRTIKKDLSARDRQRPRIFVPYRLAHTTSVYVKRNQPFHKKAAYNSSGKYPWKKYRPINMAVFTPVNLIPKYELPEDEPGETGTPWVYSSKLQVFESRFLSQGLSLEGGDSSGIRGNITSLELSGSAHSGQETDKSSAESPEDKGRIASPHVDDENATDAGSVDYVSKKVYSVDENETTSVDISSHGHVVSTIETFGDHVVSNGTSISLNQLTEDHGNTVQGTTNSSDISEAIRETTAGHLQLLNASGMTVTDRETDAALTQGSRLSATTVFEKGIFQNGTDVAGAEQQVLNRSLETSTLQENLELSPQSTEESKETLISSHPGAEESKHDSLTSVSDDRNITAPKDTTGTSVVEEFPRAYGESAASRDTSPAELIPLAESFPGRATNTGNTLSRMPSALAVTEDNLDDAGVTRPEKEASDVPATNDENTTSVTKANGHEANALPAQTQSTGNKNVSFQITTRPEDETSEVHAIKGEKLTSEGKDTENVFSTLGTQTQPTDIKGISLQEITASEEEASPVHAVKGKKLAPETEDIGNSSLSAQPETTDIQNVPLEEITKPEEEVSPVHAVKGKKLAPETEDIRNISTSSSSAQTETTDIQNVPLEEITKPEEEVSPVHAVKGKKLAPETEDIGNISTSSLSAQPETTDIQNVPLEEITKPEEETNKTHAMSDNKLTPGANDKGNILTSTLPAGKRTETSHKLLDDINTPEQETNEAHVADDKSVPISALEIAPAVTSSTEAAISKFSNEDELSGVKSFEKNGTGKGVLENSSVSSNPDKVPGSARRPLASQRPVQEDSASRAQEGVPYTSASVEKEKENR